jgi:hypothetical protein
MANEKPTALGMELEWLQSDMENVSPLSCIVIAEGFNDRGNVAHAIMSTPGMTEVQAAGLLDLAAEWVRICLQNEVVNLMTAHDADESEA